MVAEFGDTVYATPLVHLIKHNSVALGRVCAFTGMVPLMAALLQRLVNSHCVTRIGFGNRDRGVPPSGGGCGRSGCGVQW
jgi:hypothetical protein